jgi:hypothetical protein
MMLLAVRQKCLTASHGHTDRWQLLSTIMVMAISEDRHLVPGLHHSCAAPSSPFLHRPPPPAPPPTAFKLGAGASVGDLGSQPPATWPTFLKLYGQKAAGATAAASLAIWPVLPQLVRHWFYALCLSMTLGALWDFWCCMAVAFAGIPVRLCCYTHP